MKFIDEVEIQIISGSGGDGAVSFRREKFVPFGGPAGGNGATGGDVVFRAVDSLNTLIHFRGRRVYQADHGENGSGSRCDGRAGETLFIDVPIGTLIHDRETDLLIADLSEKGQEVSVAKGGRGGLGNAYYKTATNQTPRFAKKGLEGETLDVRLELKLLADLALVGLPNAGKSTFISTISAARPKVADYAFTTLEPNLGVVTLGKRSIVVADIPGLIEDASEGKGLGIRFLKHIERTSAIVHLIDCSMLLEPFEAIESYSIIRGELLKYSEKLAWKSEIVCLTKIDAMSEEEIANFTKALEQHTDKKVLPISSISGRNVDTLKEIMFKTKFDKKEDTE
jgi:GTP-binding protein